MKAGSITSVASGEATDYRGLTPTGAYEAVARIANRWVGITNIVDYYWNNGIYWVHIRRTPAHSYHPVDYDIPAEAIEILSPAPIF